MPVSPATHPWSYSEYDPANNNCKNYPQLQMCLLYFWKQMANLKPLCSMRREEAQVVQ